MDDSEKLMNLRISNGRGRGHPRGAAKQNFPYDFLPWQRFSHSSYSYGVENQNRRGSGVRYQHRASNQQYRGRGGRGQHVLTTSGTPGMPVLASLMRYQHRASNQQYRGRGGRGRHVLTTSDTPGNTISTTPVAGDTCAAKKLMSEFTSSVKLVGEYSEDEEKRFSHDRSQLRFLDISYLPQGQSKEVSINLNIGTEGASSFTRSGEEGLKNFLCWILCSVDKFSRKKNNAPGHTKESTQDKDAHSWQIADFVCPRNILAMLFQAPFSVQVFEFHAVSYQGSVYCVPIQNEVMDVDNVWRYSHKFQQILSGEDPKLATSCDRVHRLCVTAKLGSHSLLYYYGSDFADPLEFCEDEPSLESFVVANTTWTPEGHINIKRNKMLRQCAVCLLSRNQRHLLGFVNKENIVEKINFYTEDDIYRLGKEFFTPEAMCTSALSILSEIKKRVEQKPGQVYHFVRSAFCKYLFYEEIRSVTVTDILPSWYTEEVEQLN